MSKITKRLLKHIEISDNALVIENKFGYLEDLVKVFDNVFYVSRFPPDIKAKNLVYRNNFFEISVLPSITNVFVDPFNFNKMNDIFPVLTKYRPNIVVNTEILIERPISKSVWEIGYRPIEVFNSFQLWKKIK